MSLEFPDGFKMLNPIPIEVKMKVSSLDDLTDNPTLFVGFAPIWDEETEIHYWVSGGSVGSWIFNQLSNLSIYQADNATIRAMKNHKDGQDVVSTYSSMVYEYDSTLTDADDDLLYLKPDDISGAGRWKRIKAYIGADMIDVSDIEEGESKIMLATKTSSEASFGGSVAQLEKVGPPGLTTLLVETAVWDNNEITLTGDNQTRALGQNTQEYVIGADLFLCTSHSFGTGPTDGSATWIRNNGQDSLTPGKTQDDLIITELETEAGWNGVAQFKQITSKSKQGSWYRASSGSFLYMCIDINNGWTRVGVPETVELEITESTHPILTANLKAHDFATDSWYDDASDGINEAAEQGQMFVDYTTKITYTKHQNNLWSTIRGPFIASTIGTPTAWDGTSYAIPAFGSKI